MNPAMNPQANITPMYPGIHQPDEVEEGPNLPTAPLNTLLGFDLGNLPNSARHPDRPASASRTGS